MFSAKLFILLSVLTLADCLRILTFNIWNCGINVEKGKEKIAKHIAVHSPDVVALQEVEDANCAYDIAKLLGAEWNAIIPERNYPDVGILTPHKVISAVARNLSQSVYAKISINSTLNINFWCLHGAYQLYGPYAAYDRMVTNISQILYGEHYQKQGRAENVHEILQSPEMQHALAELDSVPMIVAGDFNCPSHLDWAESTKHLHGDWVVPWPATTQLEAFGFVDSFRRLYPDPLAVPAHTWSTCNKFKADWDYIIDEPQDRIDFIFYRGGLNVVRSELYAGTEPISFIPHHKHNDYPSDHFAVLTQFT